MSSRALASAAIEIAPHFWERFSADWKRSVLPAPHRPHYRNWSREGLHVAWIGHSTVVLSLDGFTIVTDPVFSTRIGLNFGPMTLGLKRLVQPASLIKEIPRPNLILLSHAHMDHFDLPSLRALESPETAVVTASKTSDLLRANRFGSVRELGWEESVEIGPVKVRAVPVRHWGARMRSDTYRGYNGYLIESGRYRILFGGDTAFTDSFRALRGLGRIDLAVMPVGAYDPWIHAHCNPEQAMQMANEAGAEFVLPVHHQTFQLSREPLAEPLERLLHAAGSNPDRVCLQEIGEEFRIA